MLLFLCDLALHFSARVVFPIWPKCELVPGVHYIEGDQFCRQLMDYCHYPATGDNHETVNGLDLQSCKDFYARRRSEL